MKGKDSEITLRKKSVYRRKSFILSCPIATLNLNSNTLLSGIESGRPGENRKQNLALIIQYPYLSGLSVEVIHLGKQPEEI